MFNKGKRQDFAKNYGGADAAETCGYPSKYDYNRSKVILGTYLTVLTLQKESSAY